VAAPDQVVLADQYRRQQQLITSTLSRDLLLLLRALFSTNDPGSSWPAVKMAVAAMVRDRRAQSAADAGKYYQRVRHSADLPGLAQIADPVDLNPDRLDATLDITGIGMYQRALAAGKAASDALDASAVTLSGSTSRLALEGGRTVLENTILTDSDALGWARIGGPSPCAWCAMLISRGAVYKSGKTAGDEMQGGTKYHDHDGCQAVPIFDSDHPHVQRADELYDQWIQETAGTSGKDAINAWRRYWDNRDSAPASTSGSDHGSA
jgi:hypothetical protein